MAREPAKGIRPEGNISDEGVVYKSVNSTNIHSVGWRGGCLFVRFHKNGVITRRYIYYQVPETAFENMPYDHTGSQWFIPFIKNGGYQYDEF